MRGGPAGGGNASYLGRTTCEAEVVGVVLGLLGGVAREAAHEEGRMLTEGLELVELLLGRGLEELEVVGRDETSDLDVPDVAEEGVARETEVGEDEVGLVS